MVGMQSVGRDKGGVVIAGDTAYVDADCGADAD